LDKRDMPTDEASNGAPALRPVLAAPKGVLDPAAAREKLRLARVHPSADLAPFVGHHWIVEWDLRGKESHLQKTLPYPCVHVVFDPKGAAVFGVMRGAFEYRLEERGRVFGVRFRAGAFRGFLKRPLGTITDRTLPLGSIFGVDDDAMRERVFAEPDDAGMVRVVEAMIRAVVPAPDMTIELVNRIIDKVEKSPELTRVDDLAVAAGLGVRDLQRLFADFVGVSPKWVIRRCRLHEAAYRLAQGEPVELSSLALSLGYFDHAHLTRDFKALVGKGPSEYRRDNVR
jgi:AraC-like DNA-binding protein